MTDLTAILLCGGKGERLRPFTDTVPKPLVPLNDKPLLYHLLQYLEASGISRFALCVGYRAHCIQDFVDNYKTQSSIVCVDSGDASMTDRILAARPYATGRALICYGDTLANIDLDALYACHEQKGGLATLSVYPMHSPFGIIDMEGSGRVTNFAEKPQLPYWINIGFLLCEPAALDTIPPNSDMPAFLSGLRDRHGLFAYKHAGSHLTVNTEKERLMAEAEVTEFFTVPNGQPIPTPRRVAGALAGL